MMVLWGIENILADLGCIDVVAAATCAEAVGLINAQRFDVAVLDVNLGHETSYAVADVLAHDGVPFLFSTGYSAHGVDARYLARPVLRKPYRDAELGAMLVTLLRAGNEAYAAA